MDITEKIKSFEDACAALNLNPTDLPMVALLPKRDQKSIIAYYKLTIIIRALNEGWEPDWKDWDQYKYFNYFYSTASAGVGYSSAAWPSTANSYVGSRLCFRTRNLANYAAEQFRQLYIDYFFFG